MQQSAQPSRPAREHAVLFTAFEPSGDDHAAAVIRELRCRHPDVPIYAWGGPKMERAGAIIVERTGDSAVMGIPGPGKIVEHLRINGRIREWLREHPVLVHVPVDSPAANSPIAAISRKAGVKVVNLVAPQFWAWGPWRASKLRRLSNLVLCLLPFEEGWFANQRIPARFIGHLLFDVPLDLAALDEKLATFPSGSPRIAILPGSRPKELERNFPVLLNAFRQLSAKFPGAVGVLGATTPLVEQALRRRAAEELGSWPANLASTSGATDAVVRWCDVALVVSGTVTLQVARQTRPMVVVYKSSPIIWNLLARWLMSTRFFTLPNIIAGRRIIPELVPYFGNGAEIALAAEALLSDDAMIEKQRRDLSEVVAIFRGRSAAASAAIAIEEVAQLRPAMRPQPPQFTLAPPVPA